MYGSAGETINVSPHFPSLLNGRFLSCLLSLFCFLQEDPNPFSSARNEHGPRNINPLKPCSSSQIIGPWHTFHHGEKKKTHARTHVLTKERRRAQYLNLLKKDPLRPYSWWERERHAGLVAGLTLRERGVVALEYPAGRKKRRQSSRKQKETKKFVSKKKLKTNVRINSLWNQIHSYTHSRHN